MTYSDQYKDPRWQKKRLEILNRDNFQCQYCGDTKSTLHVHHKVYNHGSNVWDYPNDVLMTYCDSCHDIVHEVYNDLSSAIIDAKLKSCDDSIVYIPDIIRKVIRMNPAEAFDVLKYCSRGV